MAEFDCEIPVRGNSFFTHLNYDIQAIIYDYLELAALLA
jgi:hypothetical protein